MCRPDSQQAVSERLDNRQSTPPPVYSQISPPDVCDADYYAKEQTHPSRHSRQRLSCCEGAERLSSVWAAQQACKVMVGEKW